MDPISYLNPIERGICNRADYHHIPVAGNIELLPLCNMSCKMCFARMSREEMEKHAPMKTWQEWLGIARQFSAAGTLFLLLTGGEPFMYPGIEQLYQEMRKLGLIISFNSNGTLIDEKIADFLAKDPPRRINITLYGASDETYAELCGNPQGFTQVMHGVKLLQERGISIKFNCSLTPYNIHDFDAIYEMAVRLDIPIEVGYYMFPPVRDNNRGNVQYRLTAEDAAKARFHYERLKYGNQFGDMVKFSLESYRNYSQTREYEKGYSCRSGNSVFWINYDGLMSACSFTTDCQVDVFKEGFDRAWNKIHTFVADSCMSPKCHQCKMKVLCGTCAAAAITETGQVDGTPEYYCELTRTYINLLEEYERGIKDETE